MSDSFADLWNSSAPAKPASQPQKLGSVPTNSAPKRTQPDVFSLLSSAGSSNPSSRSMSPMASNGPSQRSTPNAATKPPSSSGDAFSGLLGSSLATSSVANPRMTMAERAAEAERQKLESLRRRDQSSKALSAAPTVWDGLDSLAKPSAPSLASTSSKPGQSLVDDDWDLGDFGSQPPAKQNAKSGPTITTGDDDWLGEFANRPPSQLRSSTSNSENSRPSPPLPSRRRADSPGDFDFGNREDALLDDDSNDEDDILGDLARPVDSLSKRKTPPATERHNSPALQPTTSTNSRTRTPASRPISPPPHILGQIVEMGFSVQQARVALAATDTGLDVQAALETLIASGAASGTPPRQPSPPSADYNPPRTAGRLMPTDRERDSPSPANAQQDIREHADKLIAQASEIGMSMFSKASSFWKEGKERVQKAYVERANAAPASTSGRPRWMTEQATQEDEGGDPWKETLRDSGSRFTDGTESASERGQPQPQPQPQRRQQPERAAESKPKVTSLFSDDSPVTAYVSPFRRRTPAASSVASPAASTPRATPPPLTRQAARPPSPPRQRSNLVSASPTAIANANKHKEAGSAKFKLGQYGDADASYGLGIDALPSGHLLLVPLHNNRALSRLRTGDHTGAAADAGVVLNLIGTGYHPQREAKVEKEEEGAGVDLSDAYVKALKRRAEAWEGREKWEEAVKDWGLLAGLDWAGQKARNEAARAVGRCRKMVSQSKEAENGDAAPKPAVTKPKPRPPPKPASLSRPAPPSQALESLRTANNAAEAEDQLRHELKDSVDATLLAWKGGKETNIRALLGSLDTVLWPELGLQKVGMAELVTPSQVKIKYTRTIAKLHPDKLNSSNTTVEQRMLANGVFGTLNEAWNAFKQ